MDLNKLAKKTSPEAFGVNRWPRTMYPLKKDNNL